MYHIQILAQSIHYSSSNGFPDYWLIILISLPFQFYYWRSSKRKILDKSQSIATYTHYVVYKFQLNPFRITEVINFYEIFSSNNFAAHFPKPRNFTITNLKRHNSTSQASIYLTFFFNVLYDLLYQFRLHLGKSIFWFCVHFAGSHHIYWFINKITQHFAYLTYFMYQFISHGW